MVIPAKLNKYKVGESVFVKDPTKQQLMQRQVFKIDDKLCVIFSGNMYRLVKRIKSKIQPPDYYTITLYKKMNTVK